MLRGMNTMGKVMEQVEIMSAGCHDELVPVADLYFDNLDTVLIAGEPHPIRPIAQRSIAYRLGIPLNYLNRCPMELQAVQMNHWIAQERNERLFIRFDGAEVRGVFTPRYKPGDNLRVLEQLINMGVNLDSKVQVSLDAEFMAVSLPDDNRTFTVLGDRITPGVSVSNSEVGLASLSVSAFYLRLVCTNGLVAKTKVASSFRHVSEKVLERFQVVLNDVAGQLDQGRDRIRVSMESKVDEPSSTIKALGRQFLLGKEEQEAVEWGYAYEPGSTMFHVVNAFTRGAQHPGLTAEVSHRLQRVGGEVLAMVR